MPCRLITFKAWLSRWCRSANVRSTPVLWFLRSGDRSKAFLEAVWNHTAEGEPGMWDNLQVLDLLGYTTVRPYRSERRTEWLDGTAFIDQTWNAMGGAVGNFRHYSAMPNEQRRRVMKRDLLRTDSPDNSRPARRIERLLRDVEQAVYVLTRRRKDARKYFGRRIAGEGQP